MTGHGKRGNARAACPVVVLLLATGIGLQAQSPKIYTYVGRITADSFLLAWGTAEGSGNTIGRTSRPLAQAVVEVDGRQVNSDRNWVELQGLEPDHTYDYRLLLAGREVGRGQVRTDPASAERLSFFVIGDYGNGQRPQYQIAGAMVREFEKRQRSDNPVRFVLTTGDNIYSNTFMGLFPSRSGGKDSDWREKFFEPYEALLRHIPFYPTIGNHDRRDESGDPGDEEVLTYLDNFFFPGNASSPYYTFSFGGLVDFFALDSTAMWPRGPMGANLTESGGQFHWLQTTLARSTSPWKIAYLHHPPFNAGPGHEPSMGSLAPVVAQFRKAGVQAVFSGHEHNFQFTRPNAETGNTVYVVSGAGGQVRTGRIYGDMNEAGIAGTSPQRHFLLVEIEPNEMKITPLSYEPVVVRDAQRRAIPMPLVIPRN